MHVRVVASLAASLVFAVTACTEKPKSEDVVQLGTPPTAAPGVELTAQLGTLVTLDGNASHDPDGLPLRYGWALTKVPDGSRATLADPTAVQTNFVVDVPGSYVVRLVVENGTFWSAPSVSTITVASESPNLANKRPVAAIGETAVPEANAAVTLDGSPSQDPEGEAVSYAWSVIERPAGSHVKLNEPTSAAPVLETDMNGAFVVQLVVRDSRQASAPVIERVYVDARTLSEKLQDVTLRLNPQRTGQISGGDLHPPFRKRWKIHIDPDHPGDASYKSVPLVTEDALYFIAQHPGKECFVHGYELETGTPLAWSPISLEKTACTFTQLTYSKGMLFAFSGIAEGRAFNAQTGESLWSKNVPVAEHGWRMLGPVSAYDKIYYGTGSAGIGVITQKGEEVGLIPEHMRNNRDQVLTMLAVTDKFIYSGEQYSTIYGINRADNSRVWSHFDQNCALSGTYPEMVAGPGLLYANNHGCPGTVLDLQGNLVNRMTSATQIALNGHHAIVLDPTDYFVASVDLLSGDTRWRIPNSLNTLVTPPLIINGHVVFGLYPGQVILLNEKTGEQEWSDNVGLNDGIILSNDPYDTIPDLGTNGNVLVVPTGTGSFTAYESGSEPAADDAYKGRCEAPGNQFYLEGDQSRVGTNGVDLNSGDFLFQGSFAPASRAGAMAASVLPSLKSVFINTQGTAGEDSWALTFTAGPDRVLETRNYPLDNYWRNNASGPGLVHIARRQNAHLCEKSIGQFEITRFETDGNGLRSFSANFVQHCDQAMASLRGCVKWDRSSP